MPGSGDARPTQVQQPVHDYKKQAYLLVLVAASVQVAAYVTAFYLLSELSTTIRNLTDVGEHTGWVVFVI
jgi:hypothetical protein